MMSYSFLAFTRDSADVSTVDVDSTSKHFESKVSDQSNSGVFLQIDGKFRISIAEDIFGIVTPVAEFQVALDYSRLWLSV